MTQQSVRKDYFWNTFGVLAQNAISPLLVIVITRLNGIHDSGIFSFAFSVAIIFWALGMWGGRTYQVSDIKREFSSRSYITVRLILAFVMLAGAVLFSAVNHYDALKTGVIIALVLFKVIESLADVLFGIMQVHGRLYMAGKSLAYKAVTGFTIFIVINVLTHNILWSSLSLFVVNGVFLLFYDLSIARSLEKLRISTSQIKHYVKDALYIMKRCSPIFIVTFLATFSLNIPRYFVDLYHNDQIGYFGILTMPVTLIVLVMSFILQPKVVELSHLYAKKEFTQFNKITTKLALLTSAIGVVILLATQFVGVQVLHIVFGVDFTQYKQALLIMVVGSIANALVSIAMNIFIIMRRFKAQFYTLLLSNAALVGLSVPVVKEHGLLGGICLFTLINFVQFVFFLFIYRNGLREAGYAKGN